MGASGTVAGFFGWGEETGISASTALVPVFVVPTQGGAIAVTRV
jgi:hypothetical protein